MTDDTKPERTDASVQLPRASAKGRVGTMTVTIHGPLPANHPFYLQVGRVASEWSHLEHTLDAAIWDLLPVNQVLASCVTTQILGVGPRCNAISTLGQLRGVSDDVLKPFRKLRQDSFSVGEWRNRFIHDPWYFEELSGKPAQFRAMPAVDPRYGFQEIELDDITSTIDKIKELQERARIARDALKSALDALQKQS